MPRRAGCADQSSEGCERPARGASSSGQEHCDHLIVRHGYLRAGGWVCAEPAYDPEAGVAAFYLLLSLDQLKPRYRRHFLGEEG